MSGPDRAAPRPPGLPCDECARSSWLLARLAAHVDIHWHHWHTRRALLQLTDEQLIASVARGDVTRVTREYGRFDPATLRAACAARDVVALCRHDPRYPARLRALPDLPAVLYVYGAAAGTAAPLAACERAAAVVGARRASPYGLEQARRLGSGLAAEGVTVVSGMALGVDAAAHVGALEASGTTIAVLACSPECAYPSSKRHLHTRIAETGAVVAELPPGTPPRRWCFLARNRIVAALAEVVVVVEATAQSGSLVTAANAELLGRPVAAVPGLVTAPGAAGPNALIADGATLVRGPADIVRLVRAAAAAGRAHHDRPA